MKNKNYLNEGMKIKK